MKAEARRALFSFLIELLVYSVLVIGYFFLVLHLLGPWLLNLDKEHVRLYAITSVGLIVVQAVLLEWLTTSLLRLIRGRSE
jgi:formate-dependent nitrite reductase membrane component NrfD